MDREFLLETAGNLVQPSAAAFEEYSKKGQSLVAELNKRMLARPDIAELVGEKNVIMMQDNHANHFHFMESLLTAYKPVVLVDTILWVFRAYRARGFSSTYWAAQLNTWITLFEETLSPECCSEILPFYKWMKINIPTFNQLAENDIEGKFSSH